MLYYLIMAIKKHSLFTKTLEKIRRAIASDYFFYGVLAVAALQGLWYALTVRVGMYDEGRHLGFTLQYTERLNPFMTTQPTNWDFLGLASRDGSYMFFYLMSFPARLLQLFTENQMVIAIGLRLISLAIFLTGIFVYRKVLLEIGATKALASLSLLIFILIPMIAPMGGVFTYDNALFLSSGVLFLLGARIIKKRAVDSHLLLWFSIVGFFGSVIKYQFIAVFAPALVFIVVDQILKNKGKFFTRFKRSFFQDHNRLAIAGMISLVILSLGLFIERPVYNFLSYGALQPRCEHVIEMNRCMVNDVTRRDAQAIATKLPSFEPMSPINYALKFWIPSMAYTLAIVIAPATVLPITELIIYSLLFVGVVIILICLRNFLKIPINRFVLVVILIYTLGLFYVNYSEYITTSKPFAMNGRYFLPILPLFVFFVLVGTKNLIGYKYHNIGLSVLLITIVLLMFQGGGIGTAILKIPENYYWPDSPAEEVAPEVVNAARSVILERTPFSAPQ